VVGMSAKSIRDGISHLLKRESLTKGIIIYRQDEFINIDLHIVVEYGTNISAIAKSLMDAVKYRVEEYVGVRVLNVNIFVDGIRLSPTN
ncbi:MAG: Asp23/Gls24 family envelope stress response protein, partial [Defluviitaleaceae bacterium]|nr:Asp23/Gls24 family envelope stress response protein [Defluviitaleaceae bacterium]